LLSLNYSRAVLDSGLFFFAAVQIFEKYTTLNIQLRCRYKNDTPQQNFSWTPLTLSIYFAPQRPIMLKEELLMFLRSCFSYHTSTRIIVATLLGSSGFAHGLVIDDFSSGNFQGGSFSNFYQAYRATSSGDMLGGQRGTLSTYNDGFSVSDGLYHYSSDIQYNAPGVYDENTEPLPGARLIYGESPAFPFPVLDLDLSSYSGIDVTFPSITDEFTLSLFATTFNGEYGYAEVSAPVTLSAGPAVVNLSFAQVLSEGPLDWANVASLQFIFFDGGNPLTVSVDQIEAVGAAIPEPTAFTLLAGGLLLLRLFTRAGASRTAPQ
jgi:hypothetical protein